MKILGRRGVAAALGIILASSAAAPATAQSASSAGQTTALAGANSIQNLSFDLAARAAASVLPGSQAVVGNVIQTVAQAPFAAEASWLFKNGWPLYALVDRYQTSEQLDEETNCLATAVYFEARGETLEGQMAVAKVVMNRAASGKYPSTWCATVKQPAQFSFVQHGEFPRADTESAAWRKAEAIAKLAAANIVPSLSDDVLWYHADYVAPTWGSRMTRVEKIGAHIFYRA